MSTSDSHHPPFVHEALLYRGRGELEGAVRTFVRAAADAGEPVLAVVPTPNLEFLRGALGDDGADVHFADMTEVGRNPSCLLAMIQDWLGQHGDRARVISEPMWAGRGYAETAECLRHEALVNYALADSVVQLLCPYDTENLGAEVIKGAELTHPQVRDASGTRPSDRFEDPLQLWRGERWPLGDPDGPVSEHAFAGDLRSLRQAVLDDPRLETLSRERRHDMVFAVNEAVTNVLVHGDGQCTTRIWHDGTSVVSEVSSGAEVPDVLAGRRRPSPDAPSGRGLWLINQICDLVELRSGGTGTTLRMHVRS
jgi:anti-sigma regulatory factor (Ser/Thr protein kinase)